MPTETKRTEYKKIFNKFSYKSYMKLIKKFIKKADKHFEYKKYEIDTRLNIFIIPKDAKESLDFNELEEITPEIFNNSKVIKVMMTSMSKPNDLITAYFNNKSSPNKVSLHFPIKEEKTPVKLVF